MQIYINKFYKCNKIKIYKKENIMAKEIIFSDSARNKLYSGVEKLADAVKVYNGTKRKKCTFTKNLLEHQQ